MFKNKIERIVMRFPLTSQILDHSDGSSEMQHCRKRPSPKQT